MRSGSDTDYWNELTFDTSSMLAWKSNSKFKNHNKIIKLMAVFILIFAFATDINGMQMLETKHYE